MILASRLLPRCLLLLVAAVPLCAGDAKALGETIARIEEASGGVLGLAALHAETGVQVGWRAKERFPMMSVYKVPIAIRALALMEAGALPYRKWVKVEPADFSTGYSPIRDRYPDGVVLTIGQLLQACVRESDNTASDYLLKLVGGPEAVQKTMERLTKDGIRVNRSEKEMNADLASLGAKAYDADGRDSATPEAITALLYMLQRRMLLKPQALDLLVKWMTETPMGAQRIKALLPPGTVVWHKTGTGGDKDGINLCTNDAGVIVLPNGGGHIVLTVFLKLSPGPSGAREKALAEAALAVYQFFTDQSSK